MIGHNVDHPETKRSRRLRCNGDDGPNPEGINLMTNVQQTTDIHPDIQAIVDEIAGSVPGTYLKLAEDSPFFETKTEITIPVDQFADNLGQIQPGARHFHVRIYTMQGEPVPIKSFGPDWWARVTADDSPGVVAALHSANTAAVLDGHLVVADGIFMVDDRLRVVNGESHVVLIAEDELRTQSAAAIDAHRRVERFLSQNPALLSLQPAWSDEIDVFLSDPEEPEASFDRDLGRVGISMLGSRISGQWKFEQPTILIHTRGASDNLTAADARHLADELVAAAELIEAEARPVRRPHEVDERLRILDEG